MPRIVRREMRGDDALQRTAPRSTGQVGKKTLLHTPKCSEYACLPGLTVTYGEGDLYS